MAKTSPKGDFIRKCVSEKLNDCRPHSYRELLDYTLQKSKGTEYEGSITATNMASYIAPLIRYDASYMRINHGEYQYRCAYYDEHYSIREPDHDDDEFWDEDLSHSRWKCDDDCDNWWEEYDDNYYFDDYEDNDEDEDEYEDD